MKILLSLLLLSYSTVLLSMASSKDKLQSLLPGNLQQLKTHQSSRVETEKLLGKPHLSEGKNLYWEHSGLKYALQLTFDEKDVLKSIHYTFAQKKPDMNILGDITPSRLTPYQGKAGGKYMELKEKEYDVVIDPISRTIYSVKIK